MKYFKYKTCYQCKGDIRGVLIYAGLMFCSWECIDQFKLDNSKKS